MYENRFIVFLDILGFGSLVDKSEQEKELVENIFQALLSLSPESINEEAYTTLNEEKIPNEELEEVKNTVNQLNDKLKKFYQIKISYFSDSLVVSANCNNLGACLTILEAIAKLNVTLWNNHSLLLRGGVTAGRLLHEENGPLFGPAMNRAYKLESKDAIYPRIIFDGWLIDQLENMQKFDFFAPLISSDEDFKYISLGTSIDYMLKNSTLNFNKSKKLAVYKKAKLDIFEKIERILNSSISARVKEKYDWLLKDTKSVFNQV